jgi:RNA polymerase sigma-70 factor, ECF subfamily
MSSIGKCTSVSLNDVLGADGNRPAQVVPDQPDAHGAVLVLFDECASMLERYARACGLPRELAEDVVQETFLALFRHLQLDRPRDNLRGWLMVVAHRLALRARADADRERRRHERIDGPMSRVLADPAEGPEDELSHRARAGRLRSVVRALPNRDRHCLFLRSEGWSYRAIADTLQISVGGVAKSLARSLQRLSCADRG